MTRALTVASCGSTNTCQARFSTESGEASKLRSAPGSVNGTLVPYREFGGRLRDRKGLSPQPTRRWLAAGGRNNAVQTEIFDHLPVVIETVAHCPCGERQAGRRAFAEGVLDGSNEVGFVDAFCRFMKVCERILQVFDDVCLALDRVRAVLSAGVYRGLLSQDAAAQICS